MGVIDDMFMETYLNSTIGPGVSVVNVMSQLRIGKNDFSENYDHVQTMLKCLNKYLPLDTTY